jgi:hypothetical protein
LTAVADEMHRGARLDGKAAASLSGKHDVLLALKRNPD